MKTTHPLAFIFKMAVVGLAAAFLVVLVRPDLLSSFRPVVEVRQADGPAAGLGYGPVSYADAVGQAAPAVVNIYSAKVVTENQRNFESPVLRYFFGNRESEEPRQRIETSLGSGVIISPQGYVLTNNHVISGAAEIQVSMADGRRLQASVVGTDPETDLAVLYIRAGNLPNITIASDTPPQVGDVCLAIGNPFGVGQTVTMGIISATGRDQLGINTFENFIQTDAAINPGNSGGALINARGELLGINTAIFSKSGGSQGIGFAIPASLARKVMEQIIEYGQAVRGWLGVEAQTLTEALRQSFQIPGTEGVILAGILRGGPADQAGLQPGDIITHIGQTPVGDARSVLKIIARIPPGSIVKIDGIRAGEPQQWNATVGTRPVR